VVGKHDGADVLRTFCVQPQSQGHCGRGACKRYVDYTRAHDGLRIIHTGGGCGTVSAGGANCGNHRRNSNGNRQPPHFLQKESKSLNGGKRSALSPTHRNPPPILPECSCEAHGMRSKVRQQSPAVVHAFFHICGHHTAPEVPPRTYHSAKQIQKEMTNPRMTFSRVFL
jgi:hypothetical protein